MTRVEPWIGTARKRDAPARTPAPQPPHNERPKARPEGREPQAFRQQLLNESRAPRPERHAYRDFTASNRAAREEQPRDVGAGDGQYEADANKEDGEERADLLQILDLRHAAHRGEPVHFTEFLAVVRRQPRGCRRQRRASFGDALAVAQSADELHGRVKALVKRRQERRAHGQVHLGRDTKAWKRLQSIGQYAEDRVWLA